MGKLWVGVLMLAGGAFLASPARAWHGAGHTAVGAIAWEDLKDTPATQARIRELLQKHPDYQPDWQRQKPNGGLEEGRFLMMTASLWPDDIRSEKHPSHFFHIPGWHYKDLVYEPDGKGRQAPYVAEDALKALRQVEQTLKNAPATRTVDRSAALCWLVHLAGDVHQPLHATALLSDDFPGGDGGGNLFWVARPGRPGEEENLHSYWDGLFDDRADFFNKEGEARRPEYLKAARLADDVMRAYSRQQLKSRIGKISPDFREQSGWLRESYRLAVDHAYNYNAGSGTRRLVPGIKDPKDPERERFIREPQELPAGYAENAREIAKQRVALAGYRLADVLRELFP